MSSGSRKAKLVMSLLWRFGTSKQKAPNLTSGFAMNANFGWKHVTESGHILNGNLRGLFLEIS